MDRTIKSKPTLKRLDIAAKATNEILGENDGSICKYCEAIQSIGFHWSTCTLFRVRPEMLKTAMGIEEEVVKKNINRQRTFKNEKRYTESRQKINRKMKTRPKRKFTTLWRNEI